MIMAQVLLDRVAKMPFKLKTIRIIEPQPTPSHSVFIEDINESVASRLRSKTKKTVAEASSTTESESRTAFAKNSSAVSKQETPTNSLNGEKPINYVELTGNAKEFGKNVMNAENGVIVLYVLNNMAEKDKDADTVSSSSQAGQNQIDHVRNNLLYNHNTFRPVVPNRIIPSSTVTNNNTMDQESSNEDSSSDEQDVSSDDKRIKSNKEDDNSGEGSSDEKGSPKEAIVQEMDDSVTEIMNDNGTEVLEEEFMNDSGTETWNSSSRIREQVGIASTSQGLDKNKQEIYEETTEDDSETDKDSASKAKGCVCTICGYKASSSNRLKEHFSSHSGAKSLACEICGKKFAWRRSLKSHMDSHNEDNRNECTICGKTFCSKSTLKTHMIRIHGNPSKDFKCEQCGKEFITNAELERHAFNHSSEKPFVCEYCGKAYRYKGALSVHLRSHSGEKPHKCDYCDKSFSHLSSLIGHRRRHTGEMPFQCSVCGKLFRVKRALTAHMLVHSENRPYKCDKCGKTFRSRSAYRGHLDFHLGIKRHTCTYCGRAFRAWCNMQKHMRRHQGEKPHECDTCGKSFVEKQELTNHMKSHESSVIPQNRISEPCATITVPDDEPENNDEDRDELQIMPYSSPNICSSSSYDNTQQQNIVMPPQIEIPDNSNQTGMYDCNSSLERYQPDRYQSDRYQPDRYQYPPDNYVPPYFFPSHNTPHYTSQPPPVQNMYVSNQPVIMPNKSCMSNVNPMNYNAPITNQNYGAYAYNMNTPETFLTKCRLCRSLFHSALVLRSHLLDYHRVDEENVDMFMY